MFSRSESDGLRAWWSLRPPGNLKSRTPSPYFIWAAFLLFFAAVGFAGTTVITIEVAKPGPRLNPRLYGIFLEEINFGVDGGLYAELIRNRGFEDAKPPEGYTFRDGKWQDEKGYDSRFSRFGYVTNGLPSWSLIKDGTAQGSMQLDLANPLNEATPRSLRLEIQEIGSGRLGIANEGFWGIGLVEGEKYHLSFWARCADGYDGALTASLETADGTPCSKPDQVKGVGAQWKNFKATLTASRNEPRARFVITAGSKGKVWFDMVSLFPARTFKNRPNGLRPDLAQMLADLKPGFARFPGGCVVEGGTIETAYNWKKTVGPLEQRDAVPVNFKRGAQAQAPAARREFAGQINHDGFRLAARRAYDDIYRFPIAARGFHGERGERERKV